MTIKKALAIGGLSILAITLTIFGINHNLFKSKKPEESNASSYFTEIEETYIYDEIEEITESYYSYTIEGRAEAIYQNPQANQEYTFAYRYQLKYNEQNNQIYFKVKLSQIHYKPGVLWETFTTDYQEITETINNMFLPDYFYLTQTSFNIDNNYNISTQINFRFYYKVSSVSSQLISRNFTFTTIATNLYPEIENNQNLIFENFDIYNNMQAIGEFYANGYEYGETIGYQNGLYANTQQSYEQGKQVGYTQGWNDSDAFNHPIAIQPLMLNILSMPFTFISKAFDVTLWPNTPYEFNIANFIKAMIAIAAIIFIIKLFTSGFSVMGNFTNSINSKITNKRNISNAKAQTKINKTKVNKKE